MSPGPISRYPQGRFAGPGEPRCEVTLWGVYQCRRRPHAPIERGLHQGHVFDLRAATNDADTPKPSELPDAISARDEAFAQLAVAQLELIDVEDRMDRLRATREVFTEMIAAIETLIALDQKPPPTSPIV